MIARKSARTLHAENYLALLDFEVKQELLAAEAKILESKIAQLTKPIEANGTRGAG